MNLDGQRVLEEARLDSWVPCKKLADHGIVVEPAFDLALDVGVFDFLVLLDDVFDLTNNAFEGPLAEFGGHSHVLLLTVQLYFLDLQHHIRHLKQLSAAATEPIKHFLREISINFVFLEHCDFLNIFWDFGHEPRDKDWDLLLLNVAGEDLQLGPDVPIGHLHRLQQTR